MDMRECWRVAFGRNSLKLYKADSRDSLNSVYLNLLNRPILRNSVHIYA